MIAKDTKGKGERTVRDPFIKVTREWSDLIFFNVCEK